MTITVHRESVFESVRCYKPVTMGGVRHLTHLPPVEPYTGTEITFVCELVRTVGSRTRYEHLYDCHLCTVIHELSSRE